MQKFKLSALCTALLGSVSVNAIAQEEQPKLDTISVVATQGTKIQTNVVTSEIKNERTETDLRGLLKDEPAIDFGGGNGTSQYWSIRGMGHNSIDVKVDNAYSDSQFLYHQGRFMLDPALVKIVSVQKGAGSASAGIGATNGAIVAKTLDVEDLLSGTDKRWGAKVNAGYSSNDEHSYGVTAFGKTSTDDFDFLFSANKIERDDYKAGKGYLVNGKDTVNYSALDGTSYLAKVGMNMANHRFVLSHMHEEQTGTRLVREEFVVNPADRRLSVNSQSPAYREMSQSNTNLEWNMKDYGFIKDLTANVYKMNAKRVSADDGGNRYAGSVAGETEMNINTVGANLNIDSQIGASTLLKYGVNYRHQEAEPHVLRNGVRNQEKEDVGVYAEAIKEVGDLTLTAGLRYDHFDFMPMAGKARKDGRFNPSLGLIWQATDNLNLSANHSYATRSPRMYDTLRSHGGARVGIDQSTKAEQARNTEIGFNYLTDIGAGHLSLNGSYFWQKINDALGDTANRDNHSDIPRVIINQGHISNRGYELGAAYRLGGFTARVGVAESKPEFHDVAISARAEYAIPAGRLWTSSLMYRFDQPNLEIGVRNRSAEKSKHAILPGTSTDGRPSYSVTDIFANWKPLANDRMNVNFALNNLTDENYVPHAQATNLNAMPGVGREYRVGFNYTF